MDAIQNWLALAIVAAAAVYVARTALIACGFAAASSRKRCSGCRSCPSGESPADGNLVTISPLQGIENRTASKN